MSPTLKPLWGRGLPRDVLHWPCPKGSTGPPCSHGRLTSSQSHVLTGCRRRGWGCCPGRQGEGRAAGK